MKKSQSYGHFPYSPLPPCPPTSTDSGHFQGDSFLPLASHILTIACRLRLLGLALQIQRLGLFVLQYFRVHKIHSGLCLNCHIYILLDNRVLLSQILILQNASLKLTTADLFQKGYFCCRRDQKGEDFSSERTPWPLLWAAPQSHPCNFPPNPQQVGEGRDMVTFLPKGLGCPLDCSSTAFSFPPSQHGRHFLCMSSYSPFSSSTLLFQCLTLLEAAPASLPPSPPGG